MIKKENAMKKILLLLGLCCAMALTTLAQKVTEIDGVYYKNSTPYSGLYTSTFDSGQTKFTVTLKNGLKNGEMRVYFENGKLNEIRHYAENEMDGIWTTYNEQEVQVGLANYKNGKKHGEWKVWDDNGSLIYEMNYVEGEKSGTWKKYNSEGELLSERTF
ncbi:toxin-antitoxin system YwqK family antitoxin [Mangrovibacterium sp.]|uniref:toxin-antitoxin system YwqK family antitoxin n=1 Tax=Mangrovibacterium sp. TaxID=1961364 RepID=UPI00356410EF